MGHIPGCRQRETSCRAVVGAHNALAANLVVGAVAAAELAIVEVNAREYMGSGVGGDDMGLTLEVDEQLAYLMPVDVRRLSWRDRRGFGRRWRPSGVIHSAGVCGSTPAWSSRRFASPWRRNPLRI